MDVIKIKEKGKKNLITKTWERCKSIGRGGKHHQGQGSCSSATHGLTRKSRSWHSANAPPPDDDAIRHNKRKVAPEGCFSVYVGPHKQKFVVKTEYANHPLFRMLLEEAEAEYGYSSGGPIELPCDVEVFYRVLMEMDDPDGDEVGPRRQLGCGFAKGYGGYRLLSPSRLIMINQF